MIYRTEIDGQSGEVFLDRLIADRGPLANARPVPEALLVRYQGRVPDILLDMWQAHGVGDLDGGRLRLCLPDELSAPLSVLFRGDPDFGGDCHAVAYGPFGDLLIWSERHWLVFCMQVLALVDAPFLARPPEGLNPNQVALDQVLNINPAVLDTADEDGLPMFERARKALGPLAPGQIYGLMPPVSVGKGVSVDRLAPVAAADWLTERFMGWTFMLSDFQTRQLAIRPIGGQR